jgi:hypothetical protein
MALRNFYINLPEYIVSLFSIIQYNLDLLSILNSWEIIYFYIGITFSLKWNLILFYQAVWLVLGRCFFRILFGTSVILKKALRRIIQFLHVNSGTVSRLGNDRFCLNPSQFVIHLSSCYFLYSLRYGQRRKTSPQNIHLALVSLVIFSAPYILIEKTPWIWSASEIYLPTDRPTAARWWSSANFRG